MATCEECGNDLSSQEVREPILRDGDTICEVCFHDKHEFTCSWCGEYAEEPTQHPYMVVFDSEEAGVEVGFYRILAYPISIEPLIGHGWFSCDAITWLGFLPHDIENADGYPCGFLCTACQQKVLDFLLYMTRCSIAALAA